MLLNISLIGSAWMRTRLQIGKWRIGCTSSESSSKKDKASSCVDRRAYLKIKPRLYGTFSFNTLQYPNLVGKCKIMKYGKKSISTNSLSYYIFTCFLNDLNNYKR